MQERDFVPPDSRLPAAGACPRAATAQVVININPDTPGPRCIIVSAGDHLELINTSNTTVTAIWARYAPRKLSVGQKTVYRAAFGTYLDPGVHLLRLSLYAGTSGAEIWLR